MLKLKIIKINCPSVIHGESPIWVSSKNSIFWVDVYGKKILQYHLGKKKTFIYKVKEIIGFICHVFNSQFIIGLRSGVYFYDIEKKKYKKIESTSIKNKNFRLNDGKCDNNGSLWFGVLDTKKKENGYLAKLDSSLRCKIVDIGYITPNGPAFSNNYKIMFHSDSSKKIIYKYFLNKNKIYKKTIFKNFTNFSGSPDGMTVDRNDNLWVCLYRSALIVCLNKKGRVIESIKMPTKYITSCTFFGKKLDKLFVTSSQKEILKSSNRKNYSYIFNIKNIGNDTKRFKNY